MWGRLRIDNAPFIKDAPGLMVSISDVTVTYRHFSIALYFASGGA